MMDKAALFEGRSFSQRLAGLVLGPLALRSGWEFPDLDITWLGIGAHRNAFFHSAAIPWIGLRCVQWANEKTQKDYPWLANLIRKIGGTLVGLGSFAIGVHLLVDVFQPKAVLFPLIGSLVGGTLFDDTLWLLGNAIAAFVAGVKCLRYAWGKELLEEMEKARAFLGQNSEGVCHA